MWNESRNKTALKKIPSRAEYKYMAGGQATELRFLFLAKLPQPLSPSAN